MKAQRLANSDAAKETGSEALVRHPARACFRIRSF